MVLKSSAKISEKWSEFNEFQISHVQRFLFCLPEADGAPRVLFLMGLPGAGKSTVP